MLARSTRRCEPIKYYPINETAARRAKEMNSFSDYREGSATAEYRAMVDKAAAVAEHQKTRVDPMYHEKIDHLLDTYARKLAENMNQGFAIDARVPSVMIAGPANFPVRQKEKQNRARDGNMEEWRHIQGLLDHQNHAQRRCGGSQARFCQKEKRHAYQRRRSETDYLSFGKPEQDLALYPAQVLRDRYISQCLQRCTKGT